MHKLINKFATLPFHSWFLYRPLVIVRGAKITMDSQCYAEVGRQMAPATPLWRRQQRSNRSSFSSALPPRSLFAPAPHSTAHTKYSSYQTRPANVSVFTRRVPFVVRLLASSCPSVRRVFSHRRPLHAYTYKFAVYIGVQEKKKNIRRHRMKM